MSSIAALSLAKLLAADVAGMEPQLDLVRARALKDGWTVSCTGRAGDQKVVRLVPPKKGMRKAFVTFLDNHASQRAYYYHGAVLPQSCNLRTPPTSPSGSTVLAVGKAGKLDSLLVLARNCGFLQARIRPYIRQDKLIDDLSPGGDQATLDAGEDTTNRYGPELCFSQLVHYRNSAKYHVKYED